MQPVRGGLKVSCQLVDHRHFHRCSVAGGEVVDVVYLDSGRGIPAHGVQRERGDVGSRGGLRYRYGSITYVLVG